MTNGIGIDVSGVQPYDVPGDWEFVVVKLTEGLSTPNPKFAVQWANAARTTRGVYAYARPWVSDGVRQANFFADKALAAGFKPGVDLWQLDAEDGLNSGAQWPQFVDDFMNTALARLGSRGFLYAGFYFVLANGLQPHIAKYKWWLPAYGLNDGNVHPYPSGVPADKVVIHQFTSRLNGESLDGNRIVDAVRYGAAPTPTPAPTPLSEDKVTYFYRVTDNPTVVSPLSVWVTDFIWTRHVGNPTDLANDQLWAAYEGAPHVEVHEMPYSFHQDLWQKAA